MTRPEVVAIVRTIRVETLGDTARPACEFVIGKWTLSTGHLSPLARELGALDDVPGANQARLRLIGVSDDDINGVMQTVGEVAIQVPWGTEHRLVALGLTPKRVRPRITLTAVRLDLRDAQRDGASGDATSKHGGQKSGRHVENVALEEVEFGVVQVKLLAHPLIVSATSKCHHLESPPGARVWGPLKNTSPH